MVPWPPFSPFSGSVAISVSIGPPSAGHPADADVLVGRVVARGDVVLIIGYEDDLLSVGRDVREPVVAVVVRHLGLLGAVRLHAEGLHQPLRTELNQIYVPQGENSGPSSRPSAVVRRVSSPVPSALRV